MCGTVREGPRAKFPRVSPTISVVIPTVGRPDLLSAAVACALSQTVVDTEIVVVFDGLAPGGLAHDERLVLATTGPVRRGPAAARNCGIDLSRGSLIAFLDDDDQWVPNHLEAALEGIERAPIAITWSRFLDGPARKGRTLEGYVGERILDALTPSLGCVLAARAAVPRFDEQWQAVEDVEWWLRTSQLHPVTTVSNVTHLVRRHEGRRWGNDLAARIEENTALIRTHDEYFKHHPRAAAFRLRRAGLLARRCGMNQAARRLFARSLRIHPTPRTAWHLAHSGFAWRYPS